METDVGNLSKGNLYRRNLLKQFCVLLIIISLRKGTIGYMIFVTLGSQKFQFNRLLKALDEFAGEGKIKEDILAQSGYSDYSPIHYKCKSFLDREEFRLLEHKAEIIITHGGTGAIIGAVKNGKKVIAVPRLAKYGEHVDDHQLQIITQFAEMNLIEACMDCSKLVQYLEKVRVTNYSQYVSNTETYIEKIEEFIKVL